MPLGGFWRRGLEGSKAERLCGKMWRVPGREKEVVVAIVVGGVVGGLVWGGGGLRCGGVCGLAVVRLLGGFRL